MTDQIEQYRPGFEAWALVKYHPNLLKRNRGGYIHPQLRDAWAVWLASKADSQTVTEEPSLHVRKYQVGDSDITVEWRGTAMWAVCEAGSCLGNDGRWEVEPQPSSRADDFIARCRFSLPEATRRAIEYVAAINPVITPMDGMEGA